MNTRFLAVLAAVGVMTQFIEEECKRGFLGWLTRGKLLAVPLLAGLLAGTQFAQAQTEIILYNFGSFPLDGGGPRAGVVLDKKGNLYGTTEGGGTYDGGTVFKLTPSGVETILHSFGGDSEDGAFPFAGVILDAQGNLYGTTASGGAYNRGTVFKVTPSGQETILLTFGGSVFGSNPWAGLIFDKHGNLYGTTRAGGQYGQGEVFRLTPSGEVRTLHSFDKYNGDGADPQAAVVLDTQGNLYGTTTSGGAYFYEGVAFKLAPSGEETILYNFGRGGGGARPEAGLVLDAEGNLYGTTFQGGDHSGGTVFQLTPSGQETVLYSFGAGVGDGADPYAGVTFDTKGNLYGTTYYGGAYQRGTVFMLTPSGREITLHSFNYAGGDGTYSYATPVMDSQGNLYGTTQDGGAFGAGTIFKITR